MSAQLKQQQRPKTADKYMQVTVQQQTHSQELYTSPLNNAFHNTNNIRDLYMFYFLYIIYIA